MELMHYGIKGMRWGVRNEEKKHPKVDPKNPEKALNKALKEQGVKLSGSRRYVSSNMSGGGEHTKSYTVEDAENRYLLDKNLNLISVEPIGGETEDKDEKKSKLQRAVRIGKAKIEQLFDERGTDKPGPIARLTGKTKLLSLKKFGK